MNAPEKLPLPLSIDQEGTRAQAQALFPLEELQHLDAQGALRCQIILGHGDTFGFWETPEAMIPHMDNSIRRIDLRRRIAAYLSKETCPLSALDVLMDAGVMWLTRLALLMRMGPAGVGLRAKARPLDASMIAKSLHQYLPKLVARGMVQRLANADNSSTGFASALNTVDVREFWASRYHAANLMRLTQLHDLDLWSDAPNVLEFKGKTTAVRGAPERRPPQRKSFPYPAIPDDYLAEMGPRVLWLIKDLGPNLIHLLETLPCLLPPGPNEYRVISLRISHYFNKNVWRDRHGQPITAPPFPLKHCGDTGQHMRKGLPQNDPFEWPPRHWTSVQNLAVTLQSAHLWMALLIMAARIGEVATLGRDCIEFKRDGKPYANGKTYKASRALAGKEKEWPLPEVMVDVFAQQVKLIEASERLVKTIKGSTDLTNLLGDSTHIWASLGFPGNATEKLVGYGNALLNLAERIGMTPKPGGKNLHAHRFRKTLARLAGLAIDGSQKVLMLLLGHEDVTTTLGYMQADPAFAKEVDDITRELRIMRGEALIEDMRAAVLHASSLPYGGHGGGGAPLLANAVRNYEEKLHRSGEQWGVTTARELSVLLTNNGESARLISAHVVCTKVAGEVGMCSGKRGAIVTGNCQTECPNHIEEKTGRRDTERVIPILLKHAEEHMSNKDWLPLKSNKKQLEQELKRYDDIGALWREKPEVRAILEFQT